MHRLSFLLILSFLDFGEVSGHAVAMVIRAAKCKASMGEKRQETLPIFSLLKLNGEGAKSKVTQADHLGKLAVRSALQQKEFRQSNAHDLPRYQPGARGFHPQHLPRLSHQEGSAADIPVGNGFHASSEPPHLLERAALRKCGAVGILVPLLCPLHVLPSLSSWETSSKKF